MTIKNRFASKHKTSRSSLDLLNFTDSSSKFSRIAILFTSMLKTLGSTESTTRRGKGRVGVAGNGSNNGGHIDDGSCSGDFNKILSDIFKSICLPSPLIVRLEINALTDSLASTAQIEIEFDEVNNDGSRSSNFDKKVCFLKV